MLADLKARSGRSANVQLNPILVRLACCCSLRVSEIAGLQVADVRVETSRPHLRIRRGASKGGRPRVVPLWWYSGTLLDLAEWKSERVGTGPSRRLWVRFAQTARPEPSHVTPSVAGSKPPARGSTWRALRRLRSTTGGISSSVMGWRAEGRWRRSGMRRGMPMSASRRHICT